MMNKYEILYIIRCDVEEEKRVSLIQKYQDVLTSGFNGTIDSIEELGMKSFAYEIDKKKEGYYVLMNVTCPSEAQFELDRQMRNDESIVRQMILVK